MTTRSWPLAVWLSATAAVAVAVAVLAHALLSLTSGVGGGLLKREALVHMGQAIGVGVAMYACFAFALRRLVLEPIRVIRAHLHGIASGHLTPLILNSRVSEIDVIVSSVNAMIRRMQLGERRRDVRAIAHQVKALAGRLEALDGEEAHELLRLAAQLEHGAAAPSVTAAAK